MASKGLKRILPVLRFDQFLAAVASLIWVEVPFKGGAGADKRRAGQI